MKESDNSLVTIH